MNNIMSKQICCFILIAALFLPMASAESAVVTFQPRLSIQEEYTSNFFLENDNEEHDFSTSVSPGFLTEVRGRASSISFFYEPAYHYYANHNDYSSWSHSVGLTGTHHASRQTTLNVSNSFLYTSEPIDSWSTFSQEGISSSTTSGGTDSGSASSFDSSSGSSFDSSANASAFDSAVNRESPVGSYNYSSRGSRETYYTNTASVGLEQQFGVDDSFSLNYTYAILENDDPSLDDNQSHSPSFNLVYWIAPNLWRLETTGTYTRGLYDGDSDDFHEWGADIEIFRQINRHFEGVLRYSHSAIYFDGDTEDYQIYSPSIGMRYTSTENTMVYVSVGYYIQDRKNGGNDSGFLANCDIQKAWLFRQATIRVNATSGYDLSYLDTDNLGFRVYYGGGINAQYRFTRHLTGYLFSTYQWEKYPTDASATAEDRIDNNLEYGLGSDYRITPWLTSGIQGVTRLLKSSEHENDFLEHRILLNLTISPSQPYRF